VKRKRKTAEERREEERQRTEERIRAALRWTGPPEGPDIPRPTWRTIEDGHLSGWTFNLHNRRVDASWSRAGSHYVGEAHPHPSYGSGSQRSIALYSTRELALRDLRRAVEREAAERLDAIDQELAEIAERVERDRLLTEG
jgi:hypothetical protein